MAALDGDTLQLMVNTLGLGPAARTDDPTVDGDAGDGGRSSALAL